jgi:serine/threonine-protein kinase
MTPRRTTFAPPTTALELLDDLRAARLLPARQLRSLYGEWTVADGPRRCCAELVERGLLTPFQAGPVLQGRARRLRVGPYILVDRLGAGGTGRVYKAEHRLMHRLVALKLIGRRRPFAGDSFLREIAAAGQLSHPHIVSAHDAGRARGRCFLIMEYVEGIDLEQLVRRDGPLPIPVVREAMRQTALALQCIHEAGLIHNDVKPGNVMLASKGDPNGLVFKLLDLGLARCAEGGEQSDTTPAIGFVGTPNYLPPERAEDPECGDARGDLYSLGCMAFYLLTGEVPYPGGDASDKLSRHRHATIPSVRDRRPDVPEDMAALVRRLMAKSAADRFPTAASLLAALRRPMPPSLSPSVPTVSTTNGKGVSPGRRRGWIRRGVFVAVILAGLSFMLAAQWRSSDAPARRLQPRYALPFLVDGVGEFAGLAEAIAAAPDGGHVTIRGPGPYPMRPIAWHGKTLTMRGEGDTPPILERHPSPDDAPWQALLSSDRSLSLEGLELRHAPGRKFAEGSLASCEGGSLRLHDCRLKAEGTHAAIVSRQGAEVKVTHCNIEAEAAAIAVETGQTETCRLHLFDSHLTTAGAAVALWAPETCLPTRLDLQLAGNTIAADRILSSRALPGPLRIDATDNHFTYRNALLHFHMERQRGDWRRLTAWSGQDNHLDGGAPLRIEQEERPAERLFQ